MKATGFSLQIPLHDMRYVLFGKKTCPFCGRKLIRHMEKEHVKGSQIERSRQDDMFFGDNQTVAKYTYMYECTGCCQVFSISDLMR